MENQVTITTCLNIYKLDLKKLAPFSLLHPLTNHLPFHFFLIPTISPPFSFSSSAYPTFSSPSFLFFVLPQTYHIIIHARMVGGGEGNENYLLIGIYNSMLNTNCTYIISHMKLVPKHKLSTTTYLFPAIRTNQY